LNCPITTQPSHEFHVGSTPYIFGLQLLYDPYRIEFSKPLIELQSQIIWLISIKTPMLHNFVPKQGNSRKLMTHSDHVSDLQEI